MSRRHFDPIAIFPSRLQDGKPWEAMSAENARLNGARGGTSVENHVAIIPVTNTAYDRHVRYHESLHGLYSKPARDEKEYQLRGQGLEDARLHLLHSQAKGTVRRDELTAVLRDLRTSRRKSAGDPMQALIGLRTAAHLYAEGTDKAASIRMTEMLSKHCKRVGENFERDVFATLDAIRSGDYARANSLMSSYIPDQEQPPESSGGMWPGKNQGDEPPEIADDVPAEGFHPKGEAESSVTPGMGGETPAESKFKKHGIPRLYIRKLHAIDNIKTYTGARDKRSLSGLKIKASRLALVVGPGNPRIFERVIHRDGGSVLIDASGSMSLKPKMLLELVNHAPLATIGMYNSQTDHPKDESENFGNLWIYSQGGKRAQDFSGIRFAEKHPKLTHKRIVRGKPIKCLPEDAWVGGNLVDYPAMQWLLAQPAPRYFLTDCGWTGDHTNQTACSELFSRSIATKKIIHVRYMEELQNIFARKGRTVTA